MSGLSEDALIAKFLRPLAAPGAFALKDDCALLPPSDAPLVMTHDSLVAGVHFFADDPPDLIARKALRVNLSDLAAKAARPLGYMLSLAIAADQDADWVARFCVGLVQIGFGFRFDGCALRALSGRRR